LCAWDRDAHDRLAEVLSILTPAAAAHVFSDLHRGPRLLVALARDPEKLAELAALPEIPQVMALGAFAAEVEAARRPLVPLQGATP